MNYVSIAGVAEIDDFYAQSFYEDELKKAIPKEGLPILTNTTKMY